MGKYLQGVNGPFLGKVGPVVGVSWKGMAVIRSIPKKRTKPFTPKELNHQAKFSLMNQFLSPMISFFDETFRPRPAHLTGYNCAFSYNLKNTISGFRPDLQIEYNMVLVGRGDLPNTSSAAAASLDKGTVEFNWQDNSGKGQAAQTDKAYVAIYAPKLNQWRWVIKPDTRSSGACILNVQEFAGQTGHAWLGFVSADGKNSSDSLYLGTIDIPALENAG